MVEERLLGPRRESKSEGVALGGEDGENVLRRIRVDDSDEKENEAEKEREIKIVNLRERDGLRILGTR